MFDRHHSRNSGICRNLRLLWLGTPTIRPRHASVNTFDTATFAPAISWAKKHERQISALSLAGGFAFDSWAFGSIEHASTQAVFIVYLLAAGISHRQFCMCWNRSLMAASLRTRPAPSWSSITASLPWAALLSGFCVFYIRSASVTSSWPFLLTMAAIFIGNEYMRRYHARLLFSALLFFFAIYSYAILLVPLVIGRIGRVPFLISGAIAVVLFFFYMQALARLGHERYRVARMQVFAGMAADHRLPQRSLIISCGCCRLCRWC